MPLAPGRLFMQINPTRFPAFGGLDTLAVQNRRTGFRIVPLLLSHLAHQQRVDFRPQPAARPTPEIAVHCLPRRQVLGQHPPLTARANNIQNGVDNLPHFPFVRASALAWREKLFDQQPFAILPVGRVDLGEFGNSPNLLDF